MSWKVESQVNEAFGSIGKYQEYITSVFVDHLIYREELRGQLVRDFGNEEVVLEMVQMALEPGERAGMGLKKWTEFVEKRAVNGLRSVAAHYPIVATALVPYAGEDVLSKSLSSRLIEGRLMGQFWLEKMEADVNSGLAYPLLTMRIDNLELRRWVGKGKRARFQRLGELMFHVLEKVNWKVRGHI